MSRTHFDVLIIGSGAGGGVAAHALAHQGKTVALVDKDTFGGEGLHNGCIPTRSLIESAKVFETVKHSPKFGIRAHGLQASMPAVLARARKVVHESGFDDSISTFSHEGITTFRARAFFIDSHTVSLGTSRITAKSIIIATGAQPFVPDVPGLTSTGFITYRDVLQMTKTPKSMLIIGGGVIGCEYADFYSSFGVRVHLIEPQNHLMMSEEPEVSRLVRGRLEKKGVTVHTSTMVKAVEGTRHRKTVHLQHEGETSLLTVEELFVATGRSPHLDIGLDNAGVAFTKRGITVNDRMMTSQKHIYAIGDVTGVETYAHRASHEAKVVVHNLLHRSKKIRISPTASPRSAVVGSEIVAVGMTEAEARRQKLVYQTAITPLDVLPRSVIAGTNDGFVKLIASHTGVIIGATIASERAHDIVSVVTLAIHHGMTAKDLSDICFPFPSWSEAIRVTAAKLHTTS